MNLDILRCLKAENKKVYIERLIGLNMKKGIENKVKEILIRSKRGYLDAEEIAKKINVKNPFIINSILENFEKKGLVISR